MGGGDNKGGFAERFRGSGNIAVKIPDNMAPSDAAPLLCAGITVWSPIKKYVTKPGMKVCQVSLCCAAHVICLYAWHLGMGLSQLAQPSHLSVSML